MNNIKINCYMCSSLDNVIYHICIYDEDDNIVYEKNTNKKLIFNPKHNGIFKVIASIDNKYNSYIKRKTLIFNSNHTKNINIIFHKKYINKPKIIYFTDKNYKNMPIMKGEIILWQKVT